MEAIKNGLCKNLTPAQLWSGARFFLLLNLSLIICAAALNFYCAPNHFVFGGTTGLSVVLATCFPALSVSTFMWITNAVLDVLGCVFLGIKAMGWTLYSSFMLSFYSSMCEKLFPMSQPLTDDTLLELCFAVALPALASGIVFNIGASTGGTEIVAMILHKYIKVYGLAVLADPCGVVTVRIVFTRSASVIFNLIEGDRHTQLHSETEHIGNFLALVCFHLLSHFYCSLIIDGIRQEQLSTNRFHVVFCANHCLFVFYIMLQ